MPVIINGNRIVPAPTVTINKEFVTNRGDGVVTSNYTFTLNGTLVTNKGNPQSSGVMLFNSNLQSIECRWVSRAY